MYSLLVTYQKEDGLGYATEIEQDRFLEYTNDSIRSQLASLSTEAVDCLKAWPCLLMQEGRGEEVVYLVQITAAQLQARKIKFAYSIVSCQPVLVNNTLWKMRQDLDMAEFEFSRNHWAVKERELLPILSKAGYTFKDSDVSQFRPMPLPVPSRRDLLRAGAAIAKWSHTEIDEFLLEAGITGLEAGRSIGGRKDRANAIIKFALDTPQATTAENSLFMAHIVRRALESTKNANSAGDGFSADIDVANTKPQRLQGVSGIRGTNRVFVVHGQNEAARTAIVTELNKLGLTPIVLHEQPNMGRHLLTKFMEEAELVPFAVVLMTDDDVGSIKGGTLASRARQNVILELGYFLAYLGQRKVCALITPGLETPSDFDGIVYIRMDDGGNWKMELARELRAAEMPIMEMEI